MRAFKPVSLERAVPLFRLARAVSMSMFIIPVIGLLYQFKGLSAGDLFLVQGVFFLGIVLLEIPTGYLADLFSRKMVLVFEAVFYVLAMLILYFGHGFWFVALSELVMGFSSALASGSSEAYLFDLLKKQGAEQHYMREWGKSRTWGVAASFGATLTGGALYHVMGPNGLVLLQTAVAALFFVLASLLPDIPEVRRKVEAGKSKLRDILDISKAAALHPDIKWLTLHFSAFALGTGVLWWAMQPLMIKGDVPAAMFGFVVGFGEVCRLLFTHFAAGLFHRLKTTRFSLALFAVLVMGFLVALLLPVVENRMVLYAGLLCVAAVPAIQSGLAIVNSSMINHRIQSDERATVLSVSSMVSAMIEGAGMICLKFLVDGGNLSIGFAVMGGVVLLFAGYALVKLLRLRLA